MKEQQKINDDNLNEQLRNFFLDENSAKLNESVSQFVFTQSYDSPINSLKEKQLLKKLTKPSAGLGSYGWLMVISVAIISLLSVLFFLRKQDETIPSQPSAVAAAQESNRVIGNESENIQVAENNNGNINASTKTINQPKYSNESGEAIIAAENDADTLPPPSSGKDSSFVKPISEKSIEALAKLPVGQSMVFPKLYFKPGFHFLTDESEKELPKLLKIMQENPTLKIEIQGHITKSGNNIHSNYFKNDELDISYVRKRPLSVTRAKYIYDYLVKNGIDAHRVSFIGYGYTRPLVDHPITEADKEKNRRVEIKVLDR